jgi:ADP-heptose:LPS heptosyltransferase
VIANDAIGNFVAATPLLQMLRSHFQPEALHYFGGYRTRELQAESDLFDWYYNFHGTNPAQLLADLQGIEEYDLVVNNESTPYSMFLAPALAGNRGFIVGPSLGEGGRGALAFADDDRGRLAADREWASPEITRRYPFLDSGFIGEIFCRVAYLVGPIPRYRIPTAEPPITIPDILIATAASLPEKLWPTESWKEILRRIESTSSAGFQPVPPDSPSNAAVRTASVGLVGAKPSDQQRYWKGENAEQELVDGGLVQDLRGTMTLPQVAGALAKAKLVLTIDNGILHLAAAGNAPIVGLFREGIHRLWAPPTSNLKVLTPSSGGVVADIPVEIVWQAAAPFMQRA